jgi:outer membrane protein
MLKAQKNLEAQQRNVERLREHRRLSELRYRVGEVTESIFLRAEAELAGAEAERVAAENDLEVNKQEIQILAGLPDGFEIMEPPLPEIPGETGPQRLDVALRNRQDALRSQLQERIAKERVAFARSNFLPSITLEGTYFKRDQEPRSTFFIQDSWVVGARIKFPIFEGGLRVAELAQARSRLEQGQLETARLKKQIDLDVTRTALTLEAVTRVLHSRQEQLRFAMKNYEMVSKQFTFGLATNIDLLDANQTLIEAERDLIAATYDRHFAILDLQRSVGVFLSKVLEGSQTSM